jgi:hypothetical protein
MITITEITDYKALLSHISTGKNVQFQRDVMVQIPSYVEKISGALPAFEAYKSVAIALETEFNRKNKYIETNILALKDDWRDATTVQLAIRIDYHFKFPQNEEEKEASHVLEFIINKYRGAQDKDYQAETSYLRNLIAELRKNEGALELFGLISLVDRLERENNEFETVYNTRTNVKKIKRETGTLRQLVEKTNEAFDIFCKIINGMLHMPIDDDTKTNLEQIAGLLNTQIYQYMINYHHHQGVFTSQKKKKKEADEKKEAEEKKESEKKEDEKKDEEKAPDAEELNEEENI